MIRRIVSVLMVTAMLMMASVGPAFADSVRGCNNRCGDVDQSDKSGQTTNNITNNTNNTTNNTTNNVTNCNVKDACK